MRLAPKNLLLALIALHLPLIGNALTISYTDLTPVGGYRLATPYGTSDSMQAGYGYTSQGGLHAMAWSGTASSFVDLNPSGARSSVAYGVSGNQQVGSAAFDGVNSRAGIWYGTAASFVNLNPAGAIVSEAFATSGNQQVGQVYLNGVWRAGRWSGSAASFVDLHPAVAISSAAYATSGSKQAGQVYYGVQYYNNGSLRIDHAALWSGTAASFVDLHPAGALTSKASAISGDRQGGHVTIAGIGLHAALWSGTAESFVDLNPAVAISSRIYGMSGDAQVGLAFLAAGGGLPDRVHAGLWFGTAESFIDLHTILGSDYINSTAYGVWTDGSTIKVAGEAQRNGLHQPTLWTITGVPEPSSMALLCGYIIAAAYFRKR